MNTESTDFFYLVTTTAGILVACLIVIAIALTFAQKRRNARYSRMAAAVDETLREASLITLVGHVRAEAIRKGHEVRDSQCRYYDAMVPQPAVMGACLVCASERGA
jgi:hypothetical protein